MTKLQFFYSAVIGFFFAVVLYEVAVAGGLLGLFILGVGGILGAGALYLVNWLDGAAAPSVRTQVRLKETGRK